ncbi:MAG: DNA repair protein RecO [Gammaproteobacteria bacterium]|nr:DNA repair protein RecO [Gammaproteobacteria bacterium]
MAQELESKLAFVLHSRPFKENQVIVELLLKDEGRISAVAYKGSKKNSTRSALLQPFRSLIVQIKTGKGLHSLKHVESASNSRLFSLQNNALFCGFYLNELICRLCSSDAVFEELYPLYTYALKHLDNAKNIDDKLLFNQYIQVVLRQFEARLLALLGYGVSFDHNVELGEPIEPSLYYELFDDTGFVLTNMAQRGFLGADLLAIHNMIEQDIEAFDANSDVLRQSKLILRQCLHRHLGDKPLKSRELFRK